MKWIALPEYAEKYKISCKQLNQYIKSQKIEYQFSSSKYFIKDQPLFEHHLAEDKNSKLDFKSESILNLEKTYKELFSEFKKLEKDLIKLKSEHEDLKNLTNFLEQENKTLKNVISGFQEMEHWMKDSSEDPAFPSIKQ